MNRVKVSGHIDRMPILQRPRSVFALAFIFASLTSSLGETATAQTVDDAAADGECNTIGLEDLAAALGIPTLRGDAVS